MKNTQTGAVHLLLLIAAVGVVAFLAISNLVPFKNGLLTTLFPKDSSYAFTAGGWKMAGANPQRTSWTPDEAPGDLNEAWVKPIQPYISQGIQVIGATTPQGKTVFVSTSRGLYAFNSDTGEQRWTYVTELPLGNAPTYDSSTNVLYVGGLDRKLHAISYDGTPLWTFTAGGGFQTNPLVISNVIYLGNRDGYMYAIGGEGHAQEGQEIWKYKSGGQILQSTAASTDEQILYFAAMDSKLYAIDRATGANPTTDADPRTWISGVLPGQGFHTWWPVVYQKDGQDKILLTKTSDNQAELNDQNAWINPNPSTTPNYTMTGVMGRNADQQINLNIQTNPVGGTIPNYLETNPKRRALFVFNSDGSEMTFNIDGDATADYAPFLFNGKTSTIYPPLVMKSTNPNFDNMIYFRGTALKTSGSIPGSMPFGWKLDNTSILDIPLGLNQLNSGHWPQDEPTGISGGGNYLYWSLCCDRNIGGANISTPNTQADITTNILGNGSPSRQWRYVDGYQPPMRPNSMPTIANGANADYWSQFPQYFWSADAATWDPTPSQPNSGDEGDDKYHLAHGATAAPALYDGKMFLIRSNALIAFAPGNRNNTVSPVATTPPTTGISPDTLSTTNLKTRLMDEITKIIAGGPLRPGYAKIGLFDVYTQNYVDSDMIHYWHNPGQNIEMLVRAWNRLDDNVPAEATLKAQFKTYIQDQFTKLLVPTTGNPTNLVTTACIPCAYNHIGFTNNTWRGNYDFPYPPDTGKVQNGPKTGFNVESYYGLWKYAEAFAPSSANPTQFARDIFDFNNATYKARLMNATFPLAGMDNTALVEKINLNIAGLQGYLGLKALAGYPEDYPAAGDTTEKTDELNRLLALRANNLKWDLTYTATAPLVMTQQYRYYPTLMTVWNFYHLIPTLANYLLNNPLTDPDRTPQAVLAMNIHIAPYWFVGHNDEVQLENGFTPYQQTHTLFQAKAQILQENQQELAKYLDSPIVPVGDLYYLDNLAAALERPVGAQPSLTPTPTPTPSASATPTPTPSVSPTPTPSAGNGTTIISGVGQEVFRSPSVPTASSTPTLTQMIDDTVNEAKAAWDANNSGTKPAVIIFVNNAGGGQQLIDTIKTTFATDGTSNPNQIPIAGAGTGSDQYNAFANAEFVDQSQRSMAVMALGGTGITKVVMAQQPVTPVSDTGVQTAAGAAIANALMPEIDSNKKNLVMMMGTAHYPNPGLIVTGLNNVFGGGGQVPDHIKIIGTGGASSGSSSVINGNAPVSISIAGVLIQGDYKLAIRGLGEDFGGDPATMITPLLTQVKTELGGDPDFTFYVPGHPKLEPSLNPPLVYNYSLMLDAVKSVFGNNAKLFGNEGGGEFGELTTSSQPVGVPKHWFVASLKGMPGSSSPQPSATPVPGDIVSPEGVDIFDYNELVSHFGESGSGLAADLNLSGKVDIFDYNLLLTHFGQ